MKSGIYTITNLINGKIYVGYSRNLKSRKSKHFYELRTKTHDNEYLQRSFDKYGESNFLFEVLDTCPISSLSAMEHYWCNMLNTHNRKIGYNVKPTHPEKFNICSEETRKKLSISSKGRVISDEAKRKMSEYHKNNPMSESHKMKLQIARKKVGISEKGRLNISRVNKERIRKPVSEETKKKLKDFFTGRKVPNYKRKPGFKRIGGRKAVLQYDLLGNFIKEYSGVNEVETSGYNPDSVIKVCKKLKEKYKNYVWKYKLDL